MPVLFLGSLISNQTVGKKGTLIIKGLLGNLAAVRDSLLVPLGFRVWGLALRVWGLGFRAGV